MYRAIKYNGDVLDTENMELVGFPSPFLPERINPKQITFRSLGLSIPGNYSPYKLNIFPLGRLGVIPAATLCPISPPPTKTCNLNAH